MKYKVAMITLSVALLSGNPSFAMKTESSEKREQTPLQLSPKRKVSKTIPLERRRKSSGTSKTAAKSLPAFPLYGNITPIEEDTSPRMRKSHSPVEERKNLLIDASTISLGAWVKKPGTRKFSLCKKDEEELREIMAQLANSTQEKPKELLEYPGDSSKEEYSERDISPIRQRNESIITEEEPLG